MCARLRNIYIYMSISKKTYYILTYICIHTYVHKYFVCISAVYEYKYILWTYTLTSPQSKGFPPAQPLRRFCYPSWETRRNISQLWGPEWRRHCFRSRCLDLEGESMLGRDWPNLCIWLWWVYMIIAVLSFYSFWKFIISNWQSYIVRNACYSWMVNDKICWS